MAESTDRKHRTGSDPSKDCYVHEKNRSHKSDRDTGRPHDFRSSKNKNYLNVEGHHRLYKAKSPPLDILHGMTSSSDHTRGRSRERRQDKTVSTLDSKHAVTHSSKEHYSRDHRRSKTTDRHIKCSGSKEKKLSSSQHVECYSNSSKDRKGDRLSKGCQRKEERRHEGEINRKHIKNAETSRECEKELSKDSHHGEVDVCRKEQKEKPQEALTSSGEESNATEKNSVEENSPNRKLCFMETLNLTLSPIKKPALPENANLDDLVSVDEVVESGPDADEGVQLNIEDMCMVDDSCESKAGLENVAEQSPDFPNALSQRCEDARDAQQKGKNLSATPAADKQIIVHPVQPTSGHRQPQDTAENQMNVHTLSTRKSPVSSCVKAKNVNTSGSHRGKANMASDDQVAESGDSEAPKSVMGKQNKDTSQKVHPAALADQPVAATEPNRLDSSVELKCSSPKTAMQKNLPAQTVQEISVALPSTESALTEEVPDKASLQNQPPVLIQDSQQGLCPPASSIEEKDADAVSSTISLESLPQEGLSLPEAIYILTQTSEETSDNGSVTSEQGSSTGSIAVSKVSSTTEEAVLPEKYSSLAFTPKKSFTPVKGLKNNLEATSSMPLLHDEDSMMLTLSNLKRIPDAISPLRSPIRMSKRSHLHIHGKPGHVKSLEKGKVGLMLH